MMWWKSPTGTWFDLQKYSNIRLEEPEDNKSYTGKYWKVIGVILINNIINPKGKVYFCDTNDIIFGSLEEDRAKKVWNEIDGILTQFRDDQIIIRENYFKHKELMMRNDQKLEQELNLRIESYEKQGVKIEKS